MYIIGDSLKQPDEDAKLWRYMPYSRFEAIVNEKKLFFGRASIYRKDDPYEGRFNPTAKQCYKKYSLSDFPNTTYTNSSYVMRKFLDHKVKNRDDCNDSFAQTLLINCWHKNEFESAAMWNLYSDYTNGVAITTSLARIKTAFENFEPNIFGALIRYIDMTKDTMDYGTIFGSFICKSMSFYYENEFRLLIPTDYINCIDDSIEIYTGNDYGKIKCAIDKLIDTVYLSPIVTKDFKNKVENLLANNSYNIKVVQSDILAIN